MPTTRAFRWREGKDAACLLRASLNKARLVGKQLEKLVWSSQFLEKRAEGGHEACGRPFLPLRRRVGNFQGRSRCERQERRLNSSSKSKGCARRGGGIKAGFRRYLLFLLSSWWLIFLFFNYPVSRLPFCFAIVPYLWSACIKLLLRSSSCVSCFQRTQ